jgi:type III secretion protein J
MMVAMMLVSCGYDTLYSDLDEQQANEMLALLLSHDISGRKSRIDKTWQLEIAESDLPAAMQILKSRGYPRDDFESLGQVFKKEGFVSSPLEERARLLHGLSQELSRTLAQIDGVIVARVHLAIPERRALSDTRTPSSASIFIKHRADAEIALQTAAIKALVVNSVEGLPYENVTVSFFTADPPRLKKPGEHESLPTSQNYSRTQMLGGSAAGLTFLLSALVWTRGRGRD